jgi:cytochrome c556
MANLREVLHYRWLSLFALILLIFNLFTGCSGKKEEPPQESSAQGIYKSILKDGKLKAERAKHDSPFENEGLRAKYLAIAETCDKNNTSCLEKCSNSTCEDLCLKTLSLCEKELPLEFQTLK